MRGNNLDSIDFPSLFLGSPPLAREQHFSHKLSKLSAGITPACAGTTASRRRRNSRARDHPRLRGNNIFGNSCGWPGWGSPPLAREQPVTPSGVERQIWDHPRLRGNNFLTHSYSLVILGSPPLAREQQSSSVKLLSGAGITPACAGTTCR